MAVLLTLLPAVLLVVGPGRPVDRLDEIRARDEARAAERSVSQFSTTTTTTRPPAVAGDGSPLELAHALVDDPTEATSVAAVRAMRDDGDVRWVPYLVDLIRLFGTDVTVSETRESLRVLTGDDGPESVRDVYAYYGSWMQDRGIDPGPDYVEWKARLYGLIDPSFATLIGQVDDPVLAAELQWGGVVRGGIPELNEPATVAVAAADYMTAEELTFGAVLNGQTRAYPHRILDHHELANDVLGGEPVALANCTLCRTGVLFSRRVGDLVLEFQTSGLLRNSNKVMVDRQTESLWNQLTGEAIAGPLKGTVLDRFPLTVARYGDWVGEHPDGEVVAIPVGFAYSYEPGDAYADYYGSDELWFPVLAAPEVFPAKAEVATIDLDELRLAVGIEALAEAGPQLLELGERMLLAVPTGPGARFYDATDVVAAAEVIDVAAWLEGADVTDAAVTIEGAELPRVQSGQSFWFAWYANFPDTEFWSG